MTTQVTSSPDLLRELSARIAKDSDLQEVADALTAGNNALLDGVCGSSCALAATSLATATEFDCFMVVVSDPKQLDAMASDLENFTDEKVEFFPALDATSGRSTLMDDAYGERLRLLKHLAKEKTQNAKASIKFIVTCIQALQQPVPSLQEVADQTRYIRKGETLDVEDLSEWLVKHDYHHTSAVELPGEFSVRGGIVDIYATDWTDPVRIEMFGDDVDSIRRFDTSSQRSLISLEEIEVTVLTKQRPHQSHFVEYLSSQLAVVYQQPDEINAEAKRYLERLSDFDRHHGGPDVLRSLQD